jgi:hypothetical protein
VHIGLAVVCVAALGGAAEAGDPGPAPRDVFAACRTRLAEQPDQYDSAFCFFEAARDHRAWDAGAREFDRLMRAQPENLWLPLALGHLHRNRQPSPDLAAAEAWYRRSAEGFARAGHAEGEITARSNLRDILMPLGRVDDATAEVTRVAAAADTSGDPTVKARAWIVEAGHAMGTGGDLGHAYRLLRRAEHAVVPDGPYRLQRSCLTSLGLAALRLGRVDEARSTFLQLEAMATAAGDVQTQTTARYDLLNTELLRESLLPSPGARARLLDLARRSLETAQAAGHGVVELKSHRVLAGLLAFTPARAGEARFHAERCMAMAARHGRHREEAACAWYAASLQLDRSPSEAQRLRRLALRATERANSPVVDAQNVSEHMRLAWRANTGDAVAEALAALDAIETLRAMQDTTDQGAEAFSFWANDYYWLAGRLLQDGPRRDVTLAFSVVERLRARTLLDTRERMRTSGAADDAGSVDRRARLSAIAGQQRALLDPSLDRASRAAGLARLSRLEADLHDVERAIAASGGPQPRRQTFATLSGVQQGLGPDEALLSFQVGLWETVDGDFGGGAWLVAITCDGWSVYPLPDRTHFGPAVAMFAGLLARQDGVERVAARRLFADTFSTALGDLPPAIRRLIVVPDGALHRLPFDALRDGQDAPLVSRYDLVIVPSATLWLDARRSDDRRSARALVVADPAFHAPTGEAATTRAAALDLGLSLGRLPHARRERRAVARHLRDVEAIEGASATEAAIKARDLGRYGLVHLAAHGVADESHPGRSALFLAGTDDEDGLLQAREIAAMDWTGTLVVLSACQTAAGAVLDGEGVLSLARAFFQGGARAVIGTRWAVRDADAAWFFERFYRALGDGLDAGQATTRAKREAIAEGLSPAIWAAVVLVGDGAVHAAPRRSGMLGLPTMSVCAAAVAGLTFLGARRAVRRVRTAPPPATSVDRPTVP